MPTTRRLATLIPLVLALSLSACNKREPSSDASPAMTAHDNTTLLAANTADQTQPAPKAAIPPGGVADSIRTLTYPGVDWLNLSKGLTPADFKNRVVLLDFWTYCCINCIHTLPELAKLEKEFKDDLLVVGVHSAKFENEKDSDNIRAAILRYGVEHPVVNDSDFRIWKKFGVRSWPTLVLLGADGEIVKSVAGEGQIESLKPEIRKLVAALPKKPSRTELPIALEKEKRPPTEFLYPGKVAYVADLKQLFVTDSNHHQVVAIEWNPMQPTQGKVLYRIGVKGQPGLQDGGFSGARFNAPQGLIFREDKLYVADTGNHAVRRIDLKAKTVSTIAGNGKRGEQREFKNISAKGTAIASPWDVAFFPDTETLMIATAGNHQIIALTTEDGKLQNFAGNGAESIDDGIFPKNSLSQPSGLSPYLGSLYVVDSETSSLRVLDQQGNLKTLIGKGLFDFGFKDGERDGALMQHPIGVYAEVFGVYVADTYNHAIRRYNITTKKLETVVGTGKRGDQDGDVTQAQLNEPNGIMKAGEGYIVVDTNNHKLKFYDPKKNTISTIEIEAAKTSRRLAKTLPNTLDLRGAISVNPQTTKLVLELPSGYKLNDDAPSWVALYEGKAEVAKLVGEFNRAELKTGEKLLPAMKPDKPHRIQGTLYYCKDMAASVCEIVSIDQPFDVNPVSKGELKIAIPSEPKFRKEKN